MGIELRRATAGDAPAIAALHTDSWQRTYRGDFPDDYLDRVAPTERHDYWTERLAEPDPALVTFVATDSDTGELLGFGCGVLREHPDWGHLVDNLHVHADAQGRGLGRTLLGLLFDAFARVWSEGGPESSRAPDLPHAYLWVLASNTHAIAMYEHVGGRVGALATWDSPSGARVAVYSVHWQL